ncbi:MAG: hypothetical protein JWP44_4920, partial [Mucilaginibacter sp.]|nr:hypothetical protein [Mucilaginibacter sp.]
EVYVNVQLRIERALDDIFEDDAHVVHLFLHGRCFRSFLSAIEHVDLRLDNCATLAFIIQRKPLDDKEKQEKRSKLTKLAEEELKDILRDNHELSIKAKNLAMEMSEDEVREIWKLFTDEARDKWKSWGGDVPAPEAA